MKIGIATMFWAVLLGLTQCCVGDPLDNWQWRYPLPPGDDLSAITYGKGEFVAVGSHGMIATSVDGTNWVHRPTGTDVQFESIAFGGGIFVAVGLEVIGSNANGAIFISADAINWKRAIDPNTVWWLRGVAYGNGKFVTVGGAGEILTSDSGTRWKQANDSSDCCSDLEGVCFGNGKFVVAQGGGSMIVSRDGTHWEEYDTGTPYGLWNIQFGNGYFVASGSYGIIATSINGITWSNLTSSFPFGCIAFGGGKFIADDGSTSPDGSNWTPPNVMPGRLAGVVWVCRPAPDSLSHEKSGTNAEAAGGRFSRSSPIEAAVNGIYVAVGSPSSWPMFSVSGAAAFISSDGTNWNSVNSEPYNPLAKIIYDRGRFVAVGANGCMLTSSNGVSFNQESSGTMKNLNALAGGNGLTIAAGNEATMLVSSDAVNWVQLTNMPVVEDILGLTYGNHLFIAVGNNGAILTSENGTNWFQQASGVDDSLRAVTHGTNDNFLVVGDNGTMLSSEDGTNWNRILLPTDDHLCDIAYGAGKYVVLGQNYDSLCTEVFISTSGTDWTNAGTFGAWLYGVAYGGGQFAAVGAGVDDAVEAAPIYTSPDGINWKPHFSGTTADLFSVTFGSHLFEAAGDFILESQPVSVGPSPTRGDQQGGNPRSHQPNMLLQK